jgi:hypothetical protein
MGTIERRGAARLTEKNEMTNLETKTLGAIYDQLLPSDFSQCNFNDVAERTGETVKVLRGVVTSLVKKGLAKVLDTGYAQNIIVENTEWPCDFFNDEEWEEKKTKALAAA